MDIQEVLKGLDLLFQEQRIQEVESYLEQALTKAIELNDKSAMITLLNEMIGFFRDTSQYEKSILFSQKLIAILDSLSLQGTVDYATSLLNVANAYRAAGLKKESLEHYKLVETIYQNSLDPSDWRFAAFYNNLSLLYQETEEFEKAYACLENALSILQSGRDNTMEIATTYTNMGATLVKMGNVSEAEHKLYEALVLFEKDGNRDFHYSGALAAMGDLLFQKEEYNKAKTYYEQAMSELDKNVGHTEAYERVREKLELTEQRLEEQNITDDDVTGQKKIEQNITDDDMEEPAASTNTHISGMELARIYYEQFGKRMIEEKFPNYVDKIAVGLVGEGSDCFGFDDDVSIDHDFGLGFCMWVTKETYEEIGASLQAEYDELPEEHLGFTKKKTVVTPGGQKFQRVGVFVIEDFFLNLLGMKHMPKLKEEWMYLEPHMLATATNGCVFKDEEEIFTKTRNELLAFYPEEVRIQKIAYEVAAMAQSGQYNLPRMWKRGDQVTVCLTLSEYIKHCMSVVFLLEKKYAPYYKWMFRSMCQLPLGEKIAGRLEELSAFTGFVNDQDLFTKRKELFIEQKELFIEQKRELIEEIADIIREELIYQELTMGNDGYLDNHTANILNADLRRREKEELVAQIVLLEWKAFDQVQNEGGRASCQNDWDTFQVMRTSQYLTWNRELLESYREDFLMADQRGWNLITEKYGRMMESTAPLEYEKIKDSFPVLDEKRKLLMEEIIRIQVGWMEEFVKTYPNLGKNARRIHTYEDQPWDTSYETYLRGEISTYSEKTIVLYGRFIVDISNHNDNLAKMIMLQTVKLYGYKTLEDGEKYLTH